jgi:O-methyltransferase
MGIFAPKEGTVADLFVQYFKAAAFRWPGIRELSRPRYVYNLDPAQLAWLCSSIEETKAAEIPPSEQGCIVEVGVARGMTSVFLLEHMRRTKDERTYVCLDTFSGFTDENVEYEVNIRNKARRNYRSFSYNQRELFEANLAKCGFNNMLVIEADASVFDWHKLPRIDVMLLDVDLYVPTRAALAQSFDRWSRRAHIMVDDVAPGTSYDGAHDAYLEFCTEKSFAPTKIGTKGGVIVMKG